LAYKTNIERIVLNSIFRKGKNDNMALFKTFENDYSIELSRIDRRLWSFGGNFEYICKFRFINNLNIEITTTEIDMFGFIDAIYQYLEFNMIDITYSLNNTSLSNFSISFYKDIETNNHNMIISEYNSIIGSMINRLKITFDEDKLSEFLDLIYFTFLIDIDERGEMSSSLMELL
jgi:hypothetical protein